MMTLPGFELKERLYKGVYTVVYRAVREADGRQVVLKLLKEQHASKVLLARFKYEYRLLASLQGVGTVSAYALVPSEDTLAIAMEEFGTCSLKQLLVKRTVSLKEFITLARGIASALEAIHNHGIVHKNINPANILVEEKNGMVKIIDFGIASTLSRELGELNNRELTKEMLPYISPEQTGYINRSVDFRTDYYSLGVVFYEMLTGRLPFDVQDSMELIRSHIVEMPPLPHELKKSIPSVFSDIILKLMSKTVEDRYQSLYGLEEDLKKCHEQFESVGKIESFAVASNDIFNRFIIPEKLYGREDEIKLLRDSFWRARESQAGLVLVSGHPGINKSRFINELYKLITVERGYFVSGKFNQFERNRPYTSIIQSLQSFVRKILSEGESEISVWRDRIQAALGINGQIVVEVIPEIVSIIGVQPPVTAVDVNATENRFRYVFQKFIQCLAAPEHPVVMFLDDLQWADSASLAFVQSLLCDHHSHSFLIIGAYHDNEADEMRVANEIIGAIRKAKIPITEIMLDPLKMIDVENMLMDSLHRDKQSIQGLAQLCYEKTKGNPFFLIQFLEELHKKNLIEFDPKKGAWMWDVNLIKGKNYTDNVFSFMLNKVKEFSDPTQAILKLAACLGGIFDINTLTVVSQQSQKQVADALSEALKKGIVIPLDDAYRYSEYSLAENVHYRFLHDYVQQAIYSLTGKSELSVTHIEIGRLLLQHTPLDKIEESVLDIVDHFNAGIELVTDSVEREKIARLNLMAGKKAKLSVAYKPALMYLNMGISLLEDDSWKTNYDLTLDLYNECLESAYSLGEEDRINYLYEAIILNGANILDKINAYLIKMSELHATNRASLTVDLALKVLALLNVNIPTHPTKLDSFITHMKLKFMFYGKSTEELYNYPVMTDPYAKASMDILTKLGYSLFCADQNILPLVLYHVLRLTLKYGYHPMSMQAYQAYAWFLLNMNDKRGYLYADLGLKLCERKDMDPMATHIVMLNNSILISHRYVGIQKIIENVKVGFQRAIDFGDILIAANAAMAHSIMSLHAGDELSNVSKICEKYALFTSEKNQTQNCHFVAAQWWPSLILSGYSEEEVISQTDYDIVKMTQYYLECKNYQVFICSGISIMMMNYILCHNDDAWKYACDVFPVAENMPEMFYTIYVYYYAALIFLSRYPTLSGAEKMLALKRIKKSMRKLNEFADSAPMNYLHRFYLLSAEWARVQGKNDLAEDYYDKAVELANVNNHINDEAMANEAAAKFYLGIGKSKIAQAYMADAGYCYKKWGALGKLNQLEKQYFQFFLQESQSNNLTTTLKQTTKTQGGISNVLDVTTIMKSTGVISKEIRLDSLLSTMLHIVIENAGAQKGSLLLEKRGSWYIEAQGTIEAEFNILNSIPIEGALPASIVNTVIKTKEAIVIADATTNNPYSNDPYLIEQKPKSLLCLPLLNQGNLSAILYLENNLMVNAFQENRLHLLSLLTGQMVISIDNARVYAAYERFVPKEFLTLLKKKSVVDVVIGDHIQKDMTVLFLNIPDFITLSEKMTPQQTFSLINEFLSHMESVITAHNGFIDKYFGDGFMALFPMSADDGLCASLEMLKTVKEFNAERVKNGEEALPIGIGLNSGLLMLGTVGGAERMDGTVVSDTVNVASRVEVLTKEYGFPIIITYETYSRLKNPAEYDFQEIGNVLVKGKEKPVAIYSVRELNPQAEKTLTINPS